ncbi:MAG: hypothetical protein IJX08_05085, partial [Clostridia bacterium]|nr:hypothetical protein [Clostridia bacterium]
MSNEKDTTNLPPKGKAPRFYWFTLKLYPENKRHEHFVKTTLDMLALQWYGILHDKDRYNECKILDKEDGTRELLHKRGDLKKPHYHIMIKVSNAKTVSAMRSIIT